MQAPDVSPRRQWNVFATLAVLAVVAYFAVLIAAFFTDKIGGQAFINATLPVVTAIIAGAAALLRKPDA